MPSPLKTKFQQFRVFTGLGALFVSEDSMKHHATSYRFYQNGKWTDWQLLEEPLFEEYTSSGRLASLKHNRLDRRLGQKVVNINRKLGNLKTIDSKEFRAFTSHLFYGHNQNHKPDSLEIIFQQKVKQEEALKATFKVKCHP